MELDIKEELEYYSLKEVKLNRLDKIVAQFNRGPIN